MLSGGAPPPGLAALLAGAGQGADAGQGAEPQAGPAQDGGLSALQEILDEFPALLASLTDPADVHEAVMSMKALTGIQRRLMGAQGGPAAQQSG
jgi:hypothetical protein